MSVQFPEAPFAADSQCPTQEPAQRPEGSVLDTWSSVNFRSVDSARRALSSVEPPSPR